MQNIEFRAEEVSRYYEVRLPDLNQRGAQWRCACPIHLGQGENFSVEPDLEHWYCFSKCQRGGDIIELQMRLNNSDFKTAKAEVFRIIGRDGTNKLPKAARTNEKSLRPGGARVISPARGKWREIERYPYTDESGQILYEVVRYLKPDGTKTFVQVRPSGVESAGTTDSNRTCSVPTGGIVVGLDSGKYLSDSKAERRTGRPHWKRAPDQKKDYHGLEYHFRECPRVPYRLQKVLGADTVYLPEGEKDVQALESWGLVASCNAGGAGGSRQYRTWAEHLRGRHVIILPDNDPPGHKHAAAVAAALLHVAASVRVVELPDLPESGDVTDWRDKGGTREEFQRLVEAAAMLNDRTLAARG